MSRVNQVANGQPALFAKAIPEKSIRAAIKHRMRELGCVACITDTSPVYVQHDGLTQFHSKVSEKGWPDLTGVVSPYGAAIFVETKAADGRVSANQAEMHRQLRQAGAIVIVARTLAEFETKFDAEIERLKERYAVGCKSITTVQ